MTKWLKNEEGSGLVLAIMTLLVLSVLGASLGSITISGHKMSHVNRDSSSAYYIAEAGANLAYEDMKNIVSEVYDPQSNKEAFFASIGAKFNDEISNYSDFEMQSGYQPEANIEIGESEDVGDTRIYTIQSKSNIGNHSRTAQKDVTVNWVGKESQPDNDFIEIPPNTALVSKEYIKLIGGSYISGNIHIDTTGANKFITNNGGRVSSGKVFYPITGNSSTIFNVDSTINSDKRNFELPWNDYINLVSNFPEIPDTTVLSESEFNKNTIVLDKDYYYKDFTINGDKKINTRGNEVNLVVENFEKNYGSLEVIGNGVVNLFVKNSFFIGGGGSVNKNSSTSKLNLFYYNNSPITLGGNGTYFNGSVFIKNANLTFNSGESYRGTVLSGGKKVDIINGSSIMDLMLIAPLADASMNGGGIANGTVIVNKMDMENNTSIIYKAYDSDTFPFKNVIGSNQNSDSNKAELSIEDIINSEPTKEP